jgi:zinc transport system ATP-binding protein
MKALSVANLTFKYDKQLILENINFSIEDRDFLALIGPNGGGKSTLLKLILDILPSKDASIEVFGKPNKKSLQQIGYVPQNTNVNVDFPIKVIEVVAMGHLHGKRALIGYSKEEMRCAMGALAQVGMESYAHSRIGLLSGGQRQRVMIARALCTHPKILLLDEPTANIDPEGQRQIYELLKNLGKEITIVVVSHDISVILEYANKVAYINKKIVLHDLQERKNDLVPTSGHFCEVELLQMMSRLS